MTLPLINQFLIPYEFYNTRQPTNAEMMDRVANGCPSALCVQDVKLNLIDIINTPDKAAEYLFNRGLRNQITGSIENSLNDERSSYKSARRMMCSTTPSILSSYQRIYSSTLNMEEVDAAITLASQGNHLSNGQILFHGGGLLNNYQVGQSLITTRPLSTSLCPCKAINNGEWSGKYFNEGEANLVILTVQNIQKPAFIFKIRGTEKGHEKEVLIHSGATLTVTSKTLINNKFNVYANSIPKTVPAYLIHATIY